MSPGVSLHPSTGSHRSINVEIIESGYQFIAASTSDLACNRLVRREHEINNDKITTTEKKLLLETKGVSTVLIDAYTQKILDLQEERKQSQFLSQRMFVNYERNPSDSSTIPSLFATDNENINQSKRLSDRRPHIQRHRSAD